MTEVFIMSSTYRTRARRLVMNRVTLLTRPIAAGSMQLALATAAVVATAVISTAVIATAGCSRGAKQQAEQENPPVRVAAIGRSDFAEVLTYVVDLKAHTDVRIFSPVPDRIIYFPWKDGDRIQRGDRVALIRKEGLDKGLEQVMAQAEALDIQIKNLQNELERSKGLLTAQVITQQTFDQLQTQYLATTAQRRALEASKGQLEVTAGNAIITAPIAGVIASKMAETGDMAAPGMPLCQILAINSLKATLKLIEADVAKVKVGQEAALELDAYPARTFKAVVTAIMPFLEPGTRTNAVELTLENPRDKDGAGDYLLKPGMFGRAKLVVDQRSAVLTAPEVALLLDNQLVEQQHQGKDQRRAFVVLNGVAKERIVTLGARQNDRLEVLDGLAEGEQIIVRGHHALKDGQQVTIVEAAKL